MEEMEMIEGRVKQSLEIVDKELFMRHLVFKNKPKILRKKEAEMEFVKETINGLLEIIQNKEKEKEDNDLLRY